MIDVPTGTWFHWNPYTVQSYTIVTPTSSHAASSGNSSMTEHEDIQAAAEYRGRCSTNATPSALPDIASARHTLQSVLREGKSRRTDQRIPYRTLVVTLAALEASPGLLMELCEKDRGTVISQLMRAVGGEQCGIIVRFVIRNAYRLSTHQTGCIAFTRVYDGATYEQQQEMCAFVMSRFVELSCHPFGNYVVQRVLQGAVPHVYAEASQYLSNTSFLDHCTTNKFGSHVIETFLKHAPPEGILRICEVMFRDESCVVRLGFHSIGNYTMQRALRQLLISIDVSHPLARWCVRRIPPLVASSQHALNIVRALDYQNFVEYF